MTEENTTENKAPEVAADTAGAQGDVGAAAAGDASNAGAGVTDGEPKAETGTAEEEGAPAKTDESAAGEEKTATDEQGAAERTSISDMLHTEASEATEALKNLIAKVKAEVAAKGGVTEAIEAEFKEIEQHFEQAIQKLRSKL